MPTISLPDERRLQDKYTETIAGRDCDVYVYEETFSWRLLDYIIPLGWIGMALHGRDGWTARHVRVDIPLTHGKYVRYVHDTRGRDWPTDLPPVDEQVDSATTEAERLIEAGRVEDRSCH